MKIHFKYLKILILIVIYQGCHIQNITAQSNTFPGSGNVGIGTVTPNSFLDIYTHDTRQTAILGRGNDINFRLVSSQDRTSNAQNAIVGEFGLDYDVIKNTAIRFHRGWTITGGFISFTTNNNNERMRITTEGNVGIGLLDPSNKLEVNGTVRAKEIKVEANNWPDYVFGSEYELMSLQEVEDFVHKNKHLPGVPSEMEILDSGLFLGEMNRLLLLKIEELTLYLIEQQKEINDLNSSINGK
ncbi:hypothetical protein [Anditalea andensis]|uniref:Peptidase S74 domain-containing protein n=1 Tax=Anditalea andensis TaxID=1048983 RepID=A0A074KVM4_9BACT|nr:hypothetical protein [Anditalea andensis]KEO71613.1 hypothetical protein EL17_24005 [Anditalea andensis]